MTSAYITHPQCLLHEMGSGHPECPARMQAIEALLKQQPWWPQIHYVEAPRANHEQIARAHAQSYIEKLTMISPKDDLVYLDADTAINPDSLKAAHYAAGAVICATELVLKSKVQNAFCNIRPPGHHAEHDKAMGFCLFNNIVIGALHALEEFNLERVAVIDFDVHHGNGTEDIVAHDDRILFLSSFQHPLYPHSGFDTSNPHIHNLAVAEHTTGEELIELMKEKWWPILLNFKPQLIFISAGFDAHRLDPLANLQWETNDYANLTQEIMTIANQCCNGKIVASLEGGYHLQALANSAVAMMQTLLTTAH